MRTPDPVPAAGILLSKRVAPRQRSNNTGSFAVATASAQRDPRACAKAAPSPSSKGTSIEVPLLFRCASTEDALSEVLMWKPRVFAAIALTIAFSSPALAQGCLPFSGLCQPTHPRTEREALDSPGGLEQMDCSVSMQPCMDLFAESRSRFHRCRCQTFIPRSRQGGGVFLE